MDAFLDTFSIKSSKEAVEFENFLHQYLSFAHPSLKGIIPEKLISLLYDYSAERDKLRLFYAVLDLDLVWAFMVKDSHLPAGLWNEVLSEHRSDPKSILEDFPTFRARMDVLDSFNSIILRCRACWDKYLGALVLLYDPASYDKFAEAPSRKKAFAKIAQEWRPLISSRILRAITTVSRNGLLRASEHMAKSFTKQQMEEVSQCIEYFLHHDVDYPDPALNLMSQHIESVDRIRTSEAHGTGLLRKWSLSALPPNASRDFAIYNFLNDFSAYMGGLHRTLLDIVDDDAE